jgi:Bifunctional DNA primase/polymerase, N-terminal
MNPPAAARAAFGYARRGWLVLPIEPRGKRPAGGMGLHHASANVDEIDVWYLRWPKAGVGIVCSEESGLLVVDVDPRHGGVESMRALVAVVGPLWMTTLTAETGGGGHHLVYQHPARPVRNGAHVLGSGVDVKALGYIVAAPSIHASGKPYRWLPGCPQDPQPLPPALLERLRPPPAPPRSQVPAQVSSGDPLSRLAGFVLGAQEGQRNGALYWAAKRAQEYAAAGQVAVADAEAVLSLAAREIGLGSSEIAATLRSALGAAA